LHRPAEALAAYQEVLQSFPNRFDALYGAAQAADATGDHVMASHFYTELISICPPNADRAELRSAREYVAARNL
jgi:tetratricopeptide (TPR) repeat protein